MFVSRGTGRPPTPVRARVLPVAAAVLGAASVLCQILYSRTDPGQRIPWTILTVVAFAAASALDAAARQGVRGVLALLGFAGVGGLAVEVLGSHTGFPFGEYAYRGDLGWSVAGVPLVVPLAWVMMAWPALLVGRTLVGGRRWWAVALVGGWALASWDVFLDPQMVDAGHWSWASPTPALPGVDGIPLTNFAGWLVVAVTMVALLHRSLPQRPTDVDLRVGPAPLLYLWTYGSSVWAHAFFFGRPWVALVGGVLMGAVALPFARSVWRQGVALAAARRRR
ncbi:carotenoid biosynthesis protein [Actinokineospora sp. PR83]|uniref:carotenoid biosynthesis protein n=1 Tax=Actinokineospora sp. PR83 TaxID=2884908 RepID=UPI001F40FBCD|nr:carotenoid biosynthesis protein [Actinokineospora sp. PR83]MCG8916407.1 carotenoid biosynthesis protein [Actinokineospora sp. PR83]